MNEQEKFLLILTTLGGIWGLSFMVSMQLNRRVILKGKRHHTIIDI